MPLHAQRLRSPGGVLQQGAAHADEVGLPALDQRYPCPEGYAGGRVLLSNCPGSCYTADERLMPYECAILEKP